MTAVEFQLVENLGQRAGKVRVLSGIPAKEMPIAQLLDRSPDNRYSCTASTLRPNEDF
jgi:hypothetical protein